MKVKAMMKGIMRRATATASGAPARGRRVWAGVVVCAVAGAGFVAAPGAAVAVVNGSTAASTAAFTSPSRSAAVSDSFVRANAGSLGSPWSPFFGSWGISGNAAVPDAASLDDQALDTSLRLGSSFSVSADVTTLQSQGISWVGLVFNAKADASDRYEFRVSTGAGVGWQLLRRTSGAPSADVEASGALTAPLALGGSYTLRVDRTLTAATFSVTPAASPASNLVAGGAVTIPYANGTIPATSQPLVGGYAGIYSNVGGGSFRNFQVQSTTDAPAGITDRFDAGTDLHNSWSPGGWSWQTTSAGTMVPSPAPGQNPLLEQEHVDLSGATFSFAGDVTAPAYAGSSAEWNGLAFNESAPPANTDGTVLQMYRFEVTPANGTASQWSLQRVVGNPVAPTFGVIATGYVYTSTTNSYTLRVDSPTPGTFTLQIIDKATGKLAIPVPGYGPSFPTTVTDPSPLRGGMAALYSHDGNGVFDNVSLVSSYSTGVPLVTATAKLPQQTLGHSTTGQSVLTNGNTQYVAYYNTSRYLTVASRTLDGTAPACSKGTVTAGWCIFTSTNRVNDDAHNYVTMQLDGQGQLHVIGNLHNGSISGTQTVNTDTTGNLQSDGAGGLGTQGAYLRSTTPGDISTLVSHPFTLAGIDTGVMTYPVFLKIGATLVLRFRQYAQTYLVQYNTSTQSWSSLLSNNTPLFGTDTNSLHAAYPSDIIATTTGGATVYSMAWTWDGYTDSTGTAVNGTFGSRSTISYAQSTDLIHWTTASGTPLTLPLTYAETTTVPGLSVDPAAGLHQGITQPSVALTGTGQPVVTYTRATTGTTPTMQVFASTYHPGSGGSWAVSQLTNGNQNIIPDSTADHQAPWELQGVGAARPYGPGQPTWVTIIYRYTSGWGRMIFDTATGTILADLPGRTTSARSVPTNNQGNFAYDPAGLQPDGSQAVLFWTSWPQIPTDDPKNPQGGDAYCTSTPTPTAAQPNCDATNLAPASVTRSVSPASYNPSDMYVLETRP